MVAIPRPITGNVGSRVRVVFGDTGNQWLLILDHDNGDRKWQETDWKGIPNAVSKQIYNCEAKGREVKAVDFGPNGEWFINGVKRDGTGEHSWWGGTESSAQIKEWTGSTHDIQVSFGSNLFGGETCAIIQGRNGYSLSGGLHEDLKKRLDRLRGRNKEVNFIRLFRGGQFFLSDDEGSLWVLTNEHIEKEVKKSGKVEDIAVAGDGCWVVVRGNNFVASTGVDEQLQSKLSQFFADQRRWMSARQQEIREAGEENERQELAAALAAAREADEQRAEQERRGREAVERAERERMQREAREAERAEREREERESFRASSRISSLETQLVNRLAEEATNIREAKASLESRTRSLRSAVQSLPESVRGRVSLDGIDEADSTSNSVCVVCHDEPAVMAAAPCGHVCLCSECSGICMNGGTATRQCPMCRTTMQSVLRIYLGSGRS